MRAGRLRSKLTLQTKALTPDGAGGSSLVWNDTNTFWGQISTLSGDERLSMDRDEAMVTHEVTMRYQSGVLPGNRIKHGTRFFDIRSVENVDDRGAQLRLTVDEVVA